MDSRIGGLRGALALGFLGALGCGDDAASPALGSEAGAPGLRVDFDSEGAERARELACAQQYDAAARIGSGAEPRNATNLWSVSPYLVLLPASGEGYVTLNVDVPHFDWLIYTSPEVTIDHVDPPAIEHRSAVQTCADRYLVEYGAHHDAVASWLLRLSGEPLTRATFYAVPSSTEHSDPDNAGHASHVLDADEDGGAGP